MGVEDQLFGAVNYLAGGGFLTRKLLPKPVQFPVPFFTYHKVVHQGEKVISAAPFHRPVLR